MMTFINFIHTPSTYTFNNNFEPENEVKASSPGTFKIAEDDRIQNSNTNNSCSINQNRESNLYQNLNTKDPTSFWGTVFHLIFLSAGSTVLLIPNAFIAAGLVGGFITLLLIISFYVYCMRLLLWSTQEILVCRLKRMSNLSYSDLVYEAFETGPPFARSLAWAAWFFMNCNLCLSWYGGCVLILVLIADNLQTIGSIWLDFDLQVHSIVLLLFVPVLILNLIRKLKFLEPFSILGFIFNLIAILIVLYYSSTDPAPWTGKNKFGSWDNVFPLIGVVFVNINVTGLMMSFKNEMKHPEKFEAPLGVMTISYISIFTIYLIFSVFFGMKYGVNVPRNVIAVIPSDLLLYFISIIFFVIGLYLLFPLILYVPLNVISKAMCDKHGGPVRHKDFYEYTLRTFLTALAVLLAYLYPNSINFFVTIFGTVGTSIDSIIYPCAIHSLVVWKVCKRDRKTVLILIKNLILIVIGFCLIIGVIYNLFC